MAAMSALAHARRRKQATYGKASRNSSAWNITGFADDEDELASAASVVAQPAVEVRRLKSPVKSTTIDTSKIATDTQRVGKRISEPRRPPKHVESRSMKQDMWDVPSSDDDVGNSIMRRSPPKSVGRRKIDSVVEEDVPLAPWEQKRTLRTGTALAEPAGANKIATEMQIRAKTGPQAQQGKEVLPSAESVSPEKLVSPGTGSAADRLKARRQLLDRSAASVASEMQKSSPTTQKRLEHGSSDSNPTPRKRHRQAKEATEDGGDVVMLDVPGCSLSSVQAATKVLPMASSIAGEDASLKSRAASRQQVQRNPRRGKLSNVSRVSPQTMVSAPARLTEMLVDDTDATADYSYSPSTSTSRPSTPQKHSGSTGTSSPETARKITSTPKQDHLWSQLLSEDSAVGSPSVLPLDGLTLHADRRTGVKRTAATRVLTKFSSDIGPTRERTKLVDRLKASAPSSDSDRSGSEQDESDAEDVDMSSDEPAAHESGHCQSQSYSQSTAFVESVPRITYSRVRSYLPEDSFEDGLMLSIPSAPKAAAAPSISRKMTSSNSASQQSIYDLPDSDDEDTNGRLRTVHELRAAGSNQRFMDETSGLLDDIAVHAMSARGRRRSALIELTKKLMASKAFVEKFFRQGFEQKLLAELAAPADEIADFVLAVALVSLLTEECPEHAAKSMKERHATAWLAQRLMNDSCMAKRAKDRKNNMSKAAQATFIEFVDIACAHDTFWGDLRPTAITTRTVVLKALDSLVGKLRRSGDRSELLGREEVRAILFSEHELDLLMGREEDLPTDMCLSVSTLENLATLSDGNSWPPDVVQQLGKLLISPMLASEKLRHLRFLALRLCSNLTSDNVRSCRQLTKLRVVHSLLECVSRGLRGLGSSMEAIDLDVLVLEMGVTINVAEQVESARASAASRETAPILVQLVTAFNAGQKRLLEAETEEGAAANVAYAYLAVVLAILCRNREAKVVIAGQLPGQKLHTLIEVVEEFIRHQSRVDKLTFGGEEGGEVWTAFTEKLKGILERLKTAAEQND